MTEAQIHEIARQAAREAVKETLLTLGFDPNKPLEAQADMLFVRKTRLGSEAITRQGLMIAVATVTVAILGLIWASFKGHS
ncbi:hypothetical protein [Mesorhizobium sp. INR15]|uniref:hypothetical protein n=1 Tax=Mesorhizobium sp. INR15 TaxID=2654248 RepID=UPI0018969C88|nr:hypothetical protein [Mesorhizobium sp. INR15]QPC91466.1 hypothetical protein GA829_13065 [Mesorhizobium sp. INR15]